MNKPTTTIHYSSGEEILPGDTIECPDGITGKVSMVMEPAFEIDSPFRIPPVFFVDRCDGASVPYQPSDVSIRLLCRAKRVSSPTLDATIMRVEFLQLMEELGSHSLYYPEPLLKRLTNCGLSAVATPDGQGIIVEGQLIPVSIPEWGDPGISALILLSKVYEMVIGEAPHSKMNGRGFWFKDIMNKLAIHWGLDAKYM